MLYLLFMVAIVVIGIALIPVALLVLWFVAPFLMIVVGAAILLLDWPPFQQTHDWIGMGGLGLALLGVVWTLNRYD